MTAIPKPAISLVVPVLNEEHVVVEFLTTVMPHLLQALALVGEDAKGEIVFVDDGSTDKTFSVLLKARAMQPMIRVVRLSRNFGKEAALAAGLRYAQGAAVIPLDVDLQDPPQLILEMVRRWRAGAQVVNARRADRQADHLIKSYSARLFYRLYNRVAEHPIPEDVGDFRLFDRRVVDVINVLDENDRFNKGLFSWVGFQVETIDYARPSRLTGDSKWSSWKLFRLAMDGIISSTTLPLRIWSIIGVVISCLSFLYAIFLVLLTLFTGSDVPGYSSIIVSVLFLGGLNLLSLGVMGEYVGRIAREVRRRPLFVVDKLEGFD